MQKLKLINLSLVIALVMAITIVFSRCSTDVDLNAPYMSQPIVFGLLDAAQDTQWVKINRTWLGEGDQNVYAQIQDSSEYESHRVEAYFTNEDGSQVFELKHTLLDNKDEGSFWGPYYTAYYAETPNALDTESLYNLTVIIDDTLEVTSTTDMIQPGIGNIQFPPPGTDLYFANIGSQVTYPDFLFRWSSTQGASRYDAVLTMHYLERYWVDNDLTIEEDYSPLYKTLEIPIASFDVDPENGVEDMSKAYPGNYFYTYLSTNLEKNPKITRELGLWSEEEDRVFAFDFELMIANEDLAIYLDINAPTTNIIQERPSYNNIDGGLGLWASRAVEGVYNLGYTTDTMEHLQENDSTAALNFCSPNENTPSIYCGN